MIKASSYSLCLTTQYTLGDSPSFNINFTSSAVIPYLPYSKQCRMRRRACITSKLLAKLMCNAGIHYQSLLVICSYFFCRNLLKILILTRSKRRSFYRLNSALSSIGKHLFLRHKSLNYDGSTSKGNTWIF